MEWTDARLERPIHLTAKVGTLTAEVKEVATAETKGSSFLWTIHRAEGRGGKVLQASGRAASLDGAQAVVAAIIEMLGEVEI